MSDLSRPSVAFLIAVWGESYIEQFLDLSLRSMMASGNIPAMAGQYDCTFVCLTLDKDRDVFESHPVFQKLKKLCHVAFIDIGDLIFGGNYSATVTLAYERGMRSTGDRMCDTYFVYLVSDYIMANGSLRGLMRYMAKGYSGITAGNFQIIEEACSKPLADAVDRKTGVLSIRPRELLAYSFKHLHPMTVANTVNQPFCHTSHCNRLFWRVDDNTLIGRFYLRHMLCIKPETSNYVIGASCDYSFIPEMCPSGNVGYIDDSDDYCVVELQPLAHERGFIQDGGVSQQKLTQSLSEWTTERHRGNAHTAVLFHAGELPGSTQDMINESELFIKGIEEKLSPPSPFRGHPYWISCIEAVLDSITTRANLSEYYRDGTFAGVLGSPVFEPVLTDSHLDYYLLHANRNIPGASLRRRIWRLLASLAGTAPHVYPWHPRWTDYRAIRNRLESLLSGAPSCLFISSSRTPLADWLHARRDINIVFQKIELLLVRPVSEIQALLQDTHLAIITLTSSQLKYFSLLIPRCLELFPGEATVCIVVLCEYDLRFRHHIAGAMTACVDSRIESTDIHYSTGPMRPFLDSYFSRCVEQFYRRRRQSGSGMILALLKLGVLGGLYSISNLVSIIDRRQQKFSPTSAVITLKIKPGVRVSDETESPVEEAVLSAA